MHGIFRAFRFIVAYCREFSGSVTRGKHGVSFQLTFYQLEAERMINHGLKARGSEFKLYTKQQTPGKSGRLRICTIKLPL